MSAYCNEEWGEIGLKLLQQRADKGDIKAAYAYLYYTQFEDNSYEYLDKLIAVAKQGIEQHYYHPLRHLVYRYHDRRHLSPFKWGDRLPLSEQEKQQLAQVLMIAINNNDLLAARLLSYYLFKAPPLSDADFNQAVQRMLPVVDNTFTSLVIDYFVMEAPKHDRDFVIQGFAYATLLDFYKEDDDDSIYRPNKRAYFYFLEEQNIPPLSEQEQEQGLLLSEQYKEQATAFLYLDEIIGARYMNRIEK